MTGEERSTWKGYLRALADAAAVLQGDRRDGDGPWTSHGADGGPALTRGGAAVSTASNGQDRAGDVEMFRAQMLTEMARMSVEDGLVMQIHPGSVRNHNAQVFAKIRTRQGRGHSRPTEYVRGAAAAAEPSMGTSRD